MTQPIKIKATVMYPYLTVTNDRFNKDNPKYEVTLANLSEKATEALKSLGIKTYYKEDMGNKITCKSTGEIRAYDTEGNQLDGSTVGNGSEAIAIISFYTNSYGNFPQLNKLVITELVKYEPSTVGASSVDDDLDVL